MPQTTDNVGIPATFLEEYQEKDLQTLTDLFTAHDPRTIKEMIAEDLLFDERIVTSVRRSDDGYWKIGTDAGWFSLFKIPVDHPNPKEGDIIRIYGLFGHRRHGFALNGKIVEWETPWERFAERIAMLAKFDRERRETAEEQKDDIEKWYALLKGPYKARIDRFRAQKPDFNVEGGGYETYPVLMAQRIEEWARQFKPDGEEDSVDPISAIHTFRDLPYEEQSAVIHDGEGDKYGISGFQFDVACAMARGVIEGEEI